MAAVDLVTLWPLFDEEDEDYDEYDGGAGPAGTTPSAVSFPTTRLSFRVQIALTPDFSHSRWWEWGWEDITRYVRFTPGISFTTGRPDERSTVDAGRGSLTLDNRDGRFSRRNPYGPYYGLLSKNTPIWVQVDPGSGFVTLLQHYVNEWPSRWDQSQRDATVPIATAGILRRLQQGEVFKSPLRRSILAASPTAYWPMEDAQGSTQIASGLPGGTPLLPYDPTVAFEFLDGSGGSDRWLDLIGNAAFVASTTVSITPADGFQVEFAGMSDQVTGLVAIYATADGDSFVVSAGTNDGEPHYRTASIVQSGADVVGTFYIDGVFSSTSSKISTTLLANPVIEVFKGGFTTGVVQISHLSVRRGVSSPGTRAGSADGYVGEQAHARVARICSEEGIPFVGLASSSVAMGPQPVGVTALEVLRDCEIADLGSVYETAFGLGYQSHTERDNASVKLTLDMDQGHVSEPPEPTDDDRGLTNKFTASRSGGSEATYEKTTGPTGTGVGGPGLYASSATVNVEADNQLLAAASARVARGTVDEDRWSRVEMKLTASPELIPTWTGMEPFGARINITHPPAQMAPDTIDAFIDGYSMAFTPIDWDVAINTTPGSPHRVFVLAGPSDDTNPNLGYMVPTTCVLAEDLDTTETGVDITTTPLWSTTAEDWTPGALITVDGEDMTVTAVSGGSNPQTLTVTRSVNSVVKTHTSGATVAFKFPGNLGL